MDEINEILSWWKEQTSWASAEDCHRQAVKDIEYLIELVKGKK